jgi:sulfide:quinone oxidoreductase
MALDGGYKVLIAGGGPAAIEAVLGLRALTPDAEIELIAPEPDFVYRPMSVVEPFARPGMRRYPLERLQTHGVAVRETSVERVDPARQVAVTASGDELPYDALLMAIGAQARTTAAPGLTFGGPDEAEAMHGLIQDVEGGYVRSLAFVSPPGATWSLPLYELALQTAERARDMCLHEVTVTVASAEARPLESFGDAASELVEGLLRDLGVRLVASADVPTADRTITTPLLEGRPVPGLPADPAGFLPIDAHGRVIGVQSVWAAGDGTDAPVKQGGLAAQQAETAVQSIAAVLGRSTDDTPLEPVLRGMLIAGRASWYLRRRLDGVDRGVVSPRALWSPPSKMYGRRLAPFLDGLGAEPDVVFPHGQAAIS